MLSAKSPHRELGTMVDNFVPRTRERKRTHIHSKTYTFFVSLRIKNDIVEHDFNIRSQTWQLSRPPSL